MIQLDVLYDLASEQDYVKNVKGYSRPSDMEILLPGPDGIQIDPSLKARVESALKNKQREISTTLKSMFGLDVPDRVIVRLSFYGPGGSFHPKGNWSQRDCGVTLRQDKLFDPEGSLKTDVLIHELLHLCIEPQLRKKRWPPGYDARKEWLVDEIMRSHECQALSPGHQHQSRNQEPANGLDELSFANKPNY